jgi:hypothetical protein
MTNKKPPTTDSDATIDFVDWDVESIVDQVWTDLDGQMSRSIICTTVVRLLKKYDDATIRLYVPVVVRRKATEILRNAVGQETET